MKIDAHPHGLRQDFTHEAMREVPEIMDAHAGHGKTFGQVRADRFDSLAQPRPEREQARAVGCRPPFARGRHHPYAVPLGQPRVAAGSNKALIGIMS